MVTSNTSWAIDSSFKRTLRPDIRNGSIKGKLYHDQQEDCPWFNFPNVSVICRQFLKVPIRSRVRWDNKRPSITFSRSVPSRRDKRNFSSRDLTEKEGLCKKSLFVLLWGRKPQEHSFRCVTRRPTMCTYKNSPQKPRLGGLGSMREKNTSPLLEPL